MLSAQHKEFLPKTKSPRSRFSASAPNDDEKRNEKKYLERFTVNVSDEPLRQWVLDFFE